MKNASGLESEEYTMKKSTRFVVSIVLLIVANEFGFRQAIACDQGGKELVAVLYAAAMTNPDDFPNRIYQNRDAFINDHQWRTCIREITNNLMANSLPNPQDQSIREKAYDIASRNGAPEMGEGLFNQMQQTRADMRALARQLNSLSAIIPEICAGNITTYRNSEIYSLSTFSWRMMEDAWGWRPGAVEMIRRMFFDMYDWYLTQLFRSI